MASNPKDLIAYLISDIHLSHQVPLARSCEPDWYEVQRKYLNQLKLHVAFKPRPIICAGDIFDDGWRPSRCPAELINFAIRELPRMYAIPGQHDLPYHRLDNIKKSAYWTLVEAGVIQNIEYGKPLKIENMTLHGFPWGKELHDCPEPQSTWGPHVAVVHKYLWSRKLNTGHVQAQEADLVNRTLKKLKGYDSYVVGDNHKGFLWEGFLLNCGTFFRRKIDEQDYKPGFGVLHFDGSITREYFDTSEDKFIDKEDLAETITSAGSTAVLEVLQYVAEKTVDFQSSIRTAMNDPKVAQEVRDIITKVLEGWA